MKNFIYRNRYKLLFVGITIVYFFNLFIDIMEIDAAQYSLISMEMSVTKSFLEVFQYGEDYLDKPPLLFWLSSLSYLILGISNFAYKIPSVLIAILGIYSTYEFTKIWYNKEKAILSALIVSSTQAYFLFTNDIEQILYLLDL
jgi:4-amino-4-deoxy-L-arabinose transferase-like glycosyltransferase